ncbi:hypothetical protein ED733_003973 [Metarhizium rileyi]|uniref:RNA polymerase Rpb1 repeat domain protein n=1 Tax=Metarhizium rileyi (strain RCEF 4871) TaxID=1649241 RepID=A0A5C6GAY0_METRR|nr:hypothetical protein ED733_003973 [Metarhizium rileyi]
MKTLTAVTATVLSFAALGSAHMEMTEPPPFRGKTNKFSTDVDHSMTSPLNPQGDNFPCKGYHKLMGTPQGKSVATWAPGQTYKMTIAGGANHGGGSCQAALSFDGAKTWKVIHSYVGNCPGAGESSFSFGVPTDTPAGDAIFAWTWFNRVGNREMYMNCASVTIGDAPKMRKARGVSDSISKRPGLFVANIGNGCSTADGKDLLFPEPGPDVDMKSQQTVGPVGKCGAAQGEGSGAALASAPPASVASAIASAPLNDAGSPSSTPAAVSAPVSAPGPVATETPPGAPPPVADGGKNGGSCAADYN